MDRVVTFYEDSSKLTKNEEGGNKYVCNRSMYPVLSVRLLVALNAPTLDSSWKKGVALKQHHEPPMMKKSGSSSFARGAELPGNTQVEGGAYSMPDRASVGGRFPFCL